MERSVDAGGSTGRPAQEQPADRDVGMRRVDKLVTVWLPIATAILVAGCSPLRNERSRMYESLSRQPLEQWNAEEVLRASREDVVPVADELNEKQSFFEKLSGGFKKSIGKGPNAEAARQLFAEAESDYQQAAAARNRDPSGDHSLQFLAAGKKFVNAAERWPRSYLEEDAFFMAGECYYFADRYPRANHYYEMLLKVHPNSRHLDRVEARRFTIAQFWLESYDKDPQAFYEFNFVDRARPMRDMFGNATRIFDKVRLDDPTGRLADDATMAAGVAHFERGEYLKADDYFTDLRKAFPSSEHQLQAHLRGIEAKLRSYQGPDYSGQSLDDTEKLIVQVRKQFPNEARANMEYLQRVYAEVRFKKAERQLQMARFYDRRQQYAAARDHYDRLLEGYGDVTPLADRARARRAEIADKPAAPAQRLPWLVALFPTREENRPLIATSSTGVRRR